MFIILLRIFYNFVKFCWFCLLMLLLCFPYSTPNCDQVCGPGQGVLGARDQYGCSQCQCRPQCAPYNRDTCIRDCQNRGGTFNEQRDSNGCPSCGCLCDRSLFLFHLNFVGATGTLCFGLRLIQPVGLKARVDPLSLTFC